MPTYPHTAPPRPRFNGEITISDSKVLKAVQYDMNHKVLDVTLKSGSRYRYRNVFPYAFAELLASKSSGKVYNQLKTLPLVECRKLPRK